MVFGSADYFVSAAPQHLSHAFGVVAERPFAGAAVSIPQPESIVLRSRNQQTTALTKMQRHPSQRSHEFSMPREQHLVLVGQMVDCYPAVLLSIG